MKKILLLLAVAGAAVFLVQRRRQAAAAEAALWDEATGKPSDRRWIPGSGGSLVLGLWIGLALSRPGHSGT